MKIVKATIFFFLLVFLVTSCEKLGFDSRNKYLGTWSFEVTQLRLAYSRTQGFHDTTYTSTYHGEIKLGLTQGGIIFESDGYYEEFEIDKKGKIISEVDQLTNYSETGGFEGRSIFRYHYYHQMGASREHYGTDIYGEKE
jgi:hypothetical protein